jgi:hypothetical protein
MNTMSLETQRQLRTALTEKLASRNETMVKEASSTLDTFIRKSFKEQSFMDKIMEPVQLSVDDFYKHTTSDKPMIMLEIEPECPGVIEMAYNSTTPIMTFGAKRILCGIDRIRSIRLKKEVNELLTWSVSLRDILCDLLLKQTLTRFDARGLSAINLSVGTKPNQVMRTTGAIHYHMVQDGLSPNAIAESLKYIPRLGLENGLNTRTILMNNVTHKEFAKWTPLDAGEKWTTDIINKGLSSLNSEIMGLKPIITIKRYLVPDGMVYHFADPQYIGRSYVWVEPTMIIKQRDFSVEFSVFTERGGGIFVFLGIARVKYAGV